MGPTRTLPADPQATPRTRRQPVGDPLGLDRPAATLPEPTMSAEGWRYRGIPLDGTPAQFHAAVDQLEADTVPYSYYAKVIASREQADEPLGRRSPQPLEASRQGVER